jgi:hypothetical protein
MRVKFNRKWDWYPPGTTGVFVAYKEGCTYTVRQMAGEQAIAEGAAVEITEPPIRPAPRTRKRK